MRKSILTLGLLIFIGNLLFAQLSNPNSNPITTYAEFLDFEYNSRIGSFGEIGVVNSLLYNDAGLYQNPALLSKSEASFGGSVSYMPWNIFGNGHTSFRNVNFYYSINDKNAFGIDIRNFYLGRMTYNIPMKEYYPYEICPQVTYNHRFNERISFGAAAKYIKSDMKLILPSYSGSEKWEYSSVAVDIGFNYSNAIEYASTNKMNYQIGLAINNFGPKVKYKPEPEEHKLFIPTKLRIGALLNPDFYLNDDNRLNLEFAYQAEKLLVPSPPEYYVDYETMDYKITKGKDPDISPFRALYQSFYDAPDGAKEELSEVIHKLGAEIRFSNSDVMYFALRGGRFMEHENKGNRKYSTLGAGLGLYGFSINYRATKYDEEWRREYFNTWSLTLDFSSSFGNMFRF